MASSPRVLFPRALQCLHRSRVAPGQCHLVQGLWALFIYGICTCWSLWLLPSHAEKWDIGERLFLRLMCPNHSYVTQRKSRSCRRKNFAIIKLAQLLRRYLLVWWVWVLQWICSQTDPGSSDFKISVMQYNYGEWGHREGRKQMLQNQGQDLLQTLRAYQSQFSLGVSSPVGRNFKMRKWVDKWMNPWIER